MHGARDTGEAGVALCTNSAVKTACIVIIRVLYRIVC